MVRAPRPTQSPESRVAIINAVKSPLSYMVLALLVVEVAIGLFGPKMQDPTTPLLLMIGTTVLFVIAVLFVAVFKSTALTGDRPLTDHAEHFAANLCLGADGAFRNLPAGEREQAWATLADIIGSQSKKKDAYGDFCVAVAERIKIIAQLAGRNNQALGTIKPNQQGG